MRKLKSSLLRKQKQKQKKQLNRECLKDDSGRGKEFFFKNDFRLKDRISESPVTVNEDSF